MTDPRLHVRQAQVLGEAAQRALVASPLRKPADATMHAYLSRAGVVFVDAPAGAVFVDAPAAVEPHDVGVTPEELVSDARLVDAARAPVGAFAAVETIKQLAHVGTTTQWPRGLRLDGQDQ